MPAPMCPSPMNPTFMTAPRVSAREPRDRRRLHHPGHRRAEMLEDGGRRELPTARHGADGSAVTIGARTAAARKSARAASSEALRRPGIEVAPGPRAKGYGDGT